MAGQKALLMLFRDEMSERISTARTVTEGKDLLALPERGVLLGVGNAHECSDFRSKTCFAEPIKTKWNQVFDSEFCLILR